MSIKLNVKDYCANCPDFKPHVEKESVTDGYSGNTIVHLTVITCEHRERCKKMIEYLEEVKTVEKDLPSDNEIRDIICNVQRDAGICTPEIGNTYWGPKTLKLFQKLYGMQETEEQ